MKRYLLFILPVIFLLSCKKNGSPHVEQKVDKEHSVYQYIKQLGFSDQDIIDIGDEFLVDGDIAFPKSAVPDNSVMAGPRTEQFGTGNYVGYNLQPNIRVKIDPSVSDFASEINWAMSLWNNVPNCRLKFTLTTTGSYEILFVAANLEAGSCAVSNFPMNGKPGAQVQVNVPLMSQYAVDGIRGTMAHELGHAIGFRHSNWREGRELPTEYFPEGTYITAMHLMGTPTSDDNERSMMRGTSCGLTPDKLSSNDILAMQFLYPANPPVPGTVPVFRYFSKSTTQDHFYTTDINELVNANSHDYTFEGIGFFAFASQVTGTVPVYRYHHASSGDHLYTTNYNELRSGAYGYVYEGIRFYAYPTALNGSLPVFRYFNPQIHDHFYTKNPDEFISAQGGWNSEGTAFFAY